MVIVMKKFYIFKVKNSFYKLYKENTVELYSVYNRIYRMKKADKEYGYNLFCQISEFLDKKEINDKIYQNYSDKIMYTKSGNEHIVNNIFLNEISILTVKNSNIRIESNINNPMFLKDLKYLEGHYFVCNFEENDYFFINKKKVKV